MIKKFFREKSKFYLKFKKTSKIILSGVEIMNEGILTRMDAQFKKLVKFFFLVSQSQ